MLCDEPGCRRRQGHSGDHDPRPNSPLEFLQQVDKNKVVKAGFATPRGGKKGAYQNHVSRSNKVIIPYERLASAPVESFDDGYVVRLLPAQAFSSPGVLKPELGDGPVTIGDNAFVLYRSHTDLDEFPPLQDWHTRTLTKDGRSVQSRRGDVVDHGEIVYRVPKIGDKPKLEEGPPQGIFAPEYANEDTNYLCKVDLASLIAKTIGSPYVATEASHAHAIVERDLGLSIAEQESRGQLRFGVTACPLCLRFIRYKELHALLDVADVDGLANGGIQIKGATRSTAVNLFHLHPVIYERLEHTPKNLAWGHATCNTLLGQRRCFSVAELRGAERKVAFMTNQGVETFGWISDDSTMIRSPLGAVWARLVEDTAESASDLKHLLGGLGDGT